MLPFALEFCTKVKLPLTSPYNARQRIPSI
jgi:hypothetical protein